MALTKIGKEGITGISNASDATFLTATSGEGVTLAGTLAVTGVHTVGTNAVATSDGGAVTTSIVQGLAKAWVNLNGTGTIAIRDSTNVGSVTDNGTGDYSSNFTNNMGNTNFASFGSCIGSANNVDGSVLTGFASGTAKTVGLIRVRATYGAGNTVLDPDNVSISTCGDLA